MSKVASKETEDDDDARITVTWDFDIVAGMTAAGSVLSPVE